MIGSFSGRPNAPVGQPQREQPARLAAEGVPNALKSCRWCAVMAPRHAGLRAEDAVASHRAADGAVPSIKHARTYAHCTSRGAAAAVSCVRAAIPTNPRELFEVGDLAHLHSAVVLFADNHYVLVAKISGRRARPLVDLPVDWRRGTSLTTRRHEGIAFDSQESFCVFVAAAASA
jgi:hypothetical protein